MKQENWVKSLLSFAAPCKGKMILSILFSLCSVVGGFIPYYGVYRIIQIFIEGTATTHQLLYWSAVCMGGYLIKIIGYGISTVLSHVSAYTILEGLRGKIADKLMSAPMGSVLKYSVGNLKGSIVDQVEGVEPPLAHLIPELSANLLLPIAVIIALFAMDWRMGLACLVTVPVAAVPMLLGMRAFHDKYAAYMKANADVNSTIVEYVEGIEVIKAFGQSSSSYEKFSKSVYSFKDFTMAWFKSTWVSMNLVMSILPTTLLGTLPVGIALYLNGSLTPARLAFCLMLALGIIGPLMKATQFINELKSMEFAVKDANLYLNMEELPQASQPAILHGNNIRLKNVSFSYTNKESENILHGIDLTLPSGSFTALVGPSGGGKSTIARLIARFWDVNNGSIEIGGVDIRKIPLKQLSNVVSFVAQDNFLFDCSLKENIRLGNPYASDDEVMDAANAAQCEEFIQRLEKGWDTPAGEAGKQLSGGERQRIAIARAILKNAPIVILDEATAFTDPENEAKIQRSIMALCKGKTLLVIAHRLSTIQNADQIIVLEKGRVVDIGNQQELLERCPLYVKLWSSHIGTQNWAVSGEKEVYTNV